MRVGIMLRCIAEKGGIGVYARNVVEELLEIDAENEYVLFYPDATSLGRYARFANAREVVVPGKNKLLWDQLSIPRAVRRERIDLLFHPKFTLPLFVAAKTVMVVHGADWFLPQYRHLYRPLDVLYIRAVMPLYFRRADAVISVSRYSTQGFVAAIPGAAAKLRTIYFAAKDFFRPVTDAAVLDRVKRQYALPDRFLLTVIHYDTGRKNFGNMLAAFSLLKQQGRAQKFVVAGRDVEKYANDYPLESMGVERDVVFTGWVEQRDLPAMYTLADLYLYPTRVEAFPIPVCEAMGCGCPIVTSRETGLVEIAGESALFVDPENPAEIAAAVARVLDDDELRQTLRRKGLERSQSFSWEKCARETKELFESLVKGPTPRRAEAAEAAARS